jgi:NADH-quinone oxidoreductase subunit E
MPLETSETKAAVQAVKVAIEKYGPSREELIPILNHINQEVGYLPQESLDEISVLLKVPKSQLISVASFYQMLSTKRRGKHIIKFCESAPCHVVGGREILQTLKNEINLSTCGTTSDGNWTLETTSCLGICAVGPVFMVDDDIFGNVTPEQVPQILSRYVEMEAVK